MSLNKLLSTIKTLGSKRPELNLLIPMINRAGIKDVLSSIKECTLLIPSKEMIQELKQLQDKKQYVALDNAVLSLVIKDKIVNLNDWKKQHLTAADTVVPFKNITKNCAVLNDHANLQFKDDHWHLSGTKIPVGLFLKKVKTQEKIHAPTKKGAFENDEDMLKLIKECKKKLLKPNGFKQLVGDLYNTLDQDQKEIAKCFIHGNPYAEFFLLIDSPFIKVNAHKFLKETVGDACKNYDRILQEKGKYLMCSGETEKARKLKEHIEESHFTENKYKEFYVEIAKNNGKYVVDEMEVEVCHPALAEHLYTLELFSSIMKNLGEQFEKDNKIKVLENMIDINLLTNVKSEENIIFQESENPIVNFEEFKKRFKQFGLCMIKNHSEIESDKKQIRGKDRKVKKIKRKFNKLKDEDKKKFSS